MYCALTVFVLGSLKEEEDQFGLDLPRGDAKLFGLVLK